MHPRFSFPPLSFALLLPLWIAVSLISTPVNALNWEHTPHSPNGRSYYGYLADLDVERVYYNSECSDNSCSYWINIGKRELSLNKHGQLLGWGRYLSGSYALYNSGEDLYVVASSGRPKKVAGNIMELCGFSLMPDVIVSARGEVVCASSTQLYINGKEHKLPASAIYSQLGTSYDGHWALAFIDKDYNLYVGNEHGFNRVATGLHARSDIKDTLSVFPTSRTSAWVALYEYRNKRNKSLMLYKTSRTEQQSFTVLNSIIDDAGINPEVYQTRDQQLRVRSFGWRNSYYYQIDPATLSQQQPLRNPFPEPDLAEFSFSLGSRLTSWHVSQEVKEPRNFDDDSEAKTLAKTRYQMNDSTLTEIRFSGRVLSTQLALSYLESKAEEGADELEKAASRKLFGTLGFDQFFSGASNLVIEYASEEVGGIASYSSPDKGTQQAEFVNKYVRYGLFKTEEKGVYKGLSYSKNNIPTTVAFFETGLGTPQIYFDRDFSLEKLLFVMGFDTAQYTARYMFNHSSLYLNARGGAGLFSFKISDEIKDKAEAHFGKKYDSEISVAVDASLEFGYLWQNRSLKNSGLGSTIQVGISADAELYINTLGKENKVDDDKIVTSFERIDWRYGPFIRASLIF